jgi:hypothetical protein
MATRPEGVEREEWLAERQRIWRRRNWVMNGLMWVVIGVLFVRYCA